MTEISIDLKTTEEVSLARSITVSPAMLEKRTADFINWISKEANMSFKTQQVNVDALDPEQIQRGYRQLAQIQVARLSRDWEAQVEAVNAYLTTIPQKMPVKADRDTFVREFDLQEQATLLQQLEAALVTRFAGTAQDIYDLLGAELEPMRPESRLFQTIRDYINRTSRLAQIVDLFKVRIPSERSAFEACQIGKSRVLSLFHGTRTANVRHILRQGLIIPPYAANGSRLGRGIYFGDKAARSLNYCTSNYKNWKVLFICDVAVGRYKLESGLADYVRAPHGYDSVWGTHSWSGMDEIVVYNPAQVTIRCIAVIA